MKSGFVCHRPLSPFSHETVCPLGMSWSPGERGLDCWPVHAGLLPVPAGLRDQPVPTSLPMQLSLRLKAMKRQVEEAEEEIDRLESSKKKLQRELEEQMDMNEQLQGQLNSMKKDLRWASAVTPQWAARCFQGILSPCRKLVLPVASRDESGCVHFSGVPRVILILVPPRQLDTYSPCVCKRKLRLGAGKTSSQHHGGGSSRISP